MIRYVLFFTLVYTAYCDAQVRYVNDFLNIGVGARAHAMSGSVVASVADGSAGYWNPAGLTKVKAPFQVNAMHTAWFGGVSNYDYFNLTKRLNKDKNTYGGVSFIRFGVDNIPNTLSLISADGSVRYDRIKEFSTVDYALLLSYASNIINSKTSLGGNVKVIRRVIGPFASAWGFGADLGIRYRVSDEIILGVLLKDITTTFNAWSFDLDKESKEVFRNTGNEVPISSTESTLPRAIVGASYQLGYNKVNVLVESNIDISTDGRQSGIISGKGFDIAPSIGIEIGYLKKVFVRGGIGNFQRIYTPASPTELSTSYQPTLGLGLRLGRLSVDYALANVGSVDGLLASHIFSLQLNFADRKDVTLYEN